MNDYKTDKDTVFVPHVLPLKVDLFSYITALAQRAPGILNFRTGAGRVFRDLLVHWPVLDEWEDEAQEICQKITDSIFPLVGALYAQAVEISATISPFPIETPTHIDAMSSYVCFDIKEHVERHCFLSPEHSLPAPSTLTATGVALICRPLNYRYHTIKDDRNRSEHPHTGLFELSERLVNALASIPDFIPPEKKILAMIKTELNELPQNIQRVEISREANLALKTSHLQVAREPQQIVSVTSLSALPSPVRALERRLMGHVMDKNLSVDLRAGLRKIAQDLRAFYPHVIIEDAARQETEHPLLKSTILTKDINAPIQTLPELKAHPEIKPLIKKVELLPIPPDLIPQVPSIALSVRPSVLFPSAMPKQQFPRFLEPPVSIPFKHAQIFQGPHMHPLGDKLDSQPVNKSRSMQEDLAQSTPEAQAPEVDPSKEIPHRYKNDTANQPSYKQPATEKSDNEAVAKPTPQRRNIDQPEPDTLSSHVEAREPSASSPTHSAATRPSYSKHKIKLPGNEFTSNPPPGQKGVLHQLEHEPMTSHVELTKTRVVADAPAPTLRTHTAEARPFAAPLRQQSIKQSARLIEPQPANPNEKVALTSLKNENTTYKENFGLKAEPVLPQTLEHLHEFSFHYVAGSRTVARHYEKLRLDFSTTLPEALPLPMAETFGKMMMIGRPQPKQNINAPSLRTPPKVTFPTPSPMPTPLSPYIKTKK